jgi:hypothetical protein
MTVGNVVSLLGAMRKASSPLAKAKLLALTVRVVHQLSGAERRELVTRLGVDKADWFADRLGEESNETTAEVMRELIRQAGKTDPGKWQELAAKLRDPEERRQLLAEGLEMLDELPGDEEGGAEAAQPPPPPVVQSGPSEELPSTLSLEPPAPTKPPSEAKSSPPQATGPAKPAAAPQTPTEIPKKTAPPVAKPSTRRPARFAEPARATPPPTPSKRAPKVGKAAVDRRRGPRVAARPAETRTAKGRALAEALSKALVEELEQTPSLMRRFRLLREKAVETREWSPEALRVLVELFPDGWARRRALVTLLAAGAPADFEAALGLVTETLESPTDRRWCLGSLAAGRPLTPRQREALLAGLESPAWRRRLSKRLVAG